MSTPSDSSLPTSPIAFGWEFQILYLCKLFSQTPKRPFPFELLYAAHWTDFFASLLLYNYQATGDTFIPTRSHPFIFAPPLSTVMNIMDIIPQYHDGMRVVSGGLVLLVIVSVIVHNLSFKSKIPLPPGPPGHWLFGNALPRAKQSQVFADWISQYGPVISLKHRRQVMVIIGRYQAAMDIMEKEGALLADRPRSVAAGEMLSKGLRLVMLPAGERFRRFRRAAHTHLQPKAAESYAYAQMNSSRNAILDILNAPKEHMQHTMRYASSAILRITYGNSSTNIDEETMLISKMVRRFQSLIRPGALYVDQYPFLRYVPGYASYIKTWCREESKLVNEKLDRVRRDLNTDDAGPSFVRYLLQNQAEHKLSQEEMAHLAGSFFAAGTDTTGTALTIMILAAAHHPEAQARVQEQLDLVVGCDRAPTLDDQDSLPEVQAFTLECLRWRPVTPIGFAHRATKDIIHDGYLIPAGATVLGNHWAISRDPVVYPEPEKFNPQRWLDGDGQVRDDLKFPVYGFGRRICPGQHVANRSIFINAALLLWSFRISEDPSSPININDQGLVDGIVAHPTPFNVNFEPRLGNAKQLKAVMEKYI